MAERRIIDYYGILNVPATADMAGIENAYTRLSDELARQTDEDETAGWALERLNEAYRVLSHPDQRRSYDRVYFSKEIADAAAQQAALGRRQRIAGAVMIGALFLIVAAQSVVLGYLGREYVADALSAVGL